MSNTIIDVVSVTGILGILTCAIFCLSEQMSERKNFWLKLSVLFFLPVITPICVDLKQMGRELYVLLAAFCFIVAAVMAYRQKKSI